MSIIDELEPEEIMMLLRGPGGPLGAVASVEMVRAMGISRDNPAALRAAVERADAALLKFLESPGGARRLAILKANRAPAEHRKKIPETQDPFADYFRG